MTKELAEKNKRQAKKPVKDKPKPITLEELSARTIRIERHLQSATVKNAEFALSTIRELSEKTNELVQQVNIMGGFLEETEQIDACNDWWAKKVAEQQKTIEEAMAKAKTDRVEELKKAAEAMKEADNETEGNSDEPAPEDQAGKTAQEGDKDAGGAVQPGITKAEEENGGLIEQEDPRAEKPKE